MLPSKELVAAIGHFNEEMGKAGVPLAAEGLHASSKGARIKFPGKRRTAPDGPFPRTNELLDGRPDMRYMLLIYEDETLWEGITRRRALAPPDDRDTRWSMR